MRTRKWNFVKMFSPLLLLLCYQTQAQTENDGIMMQKKQWCNGFTYMYSGWDQYWEGTLKRKNDNIGRFTNQSVVFMTNYGITDKLNVLVSVPYVWTHVTAGTLHGLHGFQDVSAAVKYQAFTTKLAGGKLKIFGVAGFSTPLSNYVIDFMPLAIGLGSTNVSGRITADYQHGIFYATVSGAYVWRSNVKIDRTAYYDTQEHITNEVQMPDMLHFNGNLGVRIKYFVGEVNVENMTTLGGFDIRRNDMPFPSNKMNMTNVGVHAKYTLPFFTHVEVLGGGSYTVAGRNVGQALMFHAGAYYIFKFK
ncbi:MAG: hypothetical protein JST75_00785 [Bacteroidetes bacterium]|nr:hypothetical protein [Bacteroidota bacterium]